MALSTIQLRLLTRDCPDIPQLVLINQEAFPPSERASIDGLFDSNDGGNLDMIGIYGEQELLGFFAVRKLGSIRYLAYFAISQTKRSGGIGSRALSLLKQFYPEEQIVVEFEAPDEAAENNTLRLRRRDFRGGINALVGHVLTPCHQTNPLTMKTSVYHGRPLMV